MTQSDTQKEMPMHDQKTVKKRKQIFEEENWNMILAGERAVSQRLRQQSVQG